MTLARRGAFALIGSFLLLPHSLHADATLKTPPPEGLREYTPREVQFTHATVVVDPTTTLADATLHIRDGKIIAVGKDVPLSVTAVQIDLTGKSIYPGFIDAYAEWPLDACKAAGQSEGSRYWNPMVAPQLRVASICRPDAAANGRWRSQGLVARYVAPSFGVIKGTGSLVATDDSPQSQSVIAADVAMHVSLNQTNPDEGYPDSPMGSYALVRQAFYDAEWYGSATKTVASHPELPSIETNTSLAELHAFVESRKPFVIDAPDEMYLLRSGVIAGEFHLPGIIRSDGYDYRLANEVAKLKMPVIVPLNFPKPPNVASPERLRSTTLEQLMHWDLAPENPARLRRAGVDIAFTSNGLKDPGQFVPAVRTTIERGLSRDDALAALTTTPARILGVDKQLGSLAPGKLASFIITDGDPFDSRKKILETWVNGSRFQHAAATTEKILGDWTVRGGDLAFSIKLGSEPRATITKIDSATTQPTSKQMGVEVSSSSVAFTIPSEISGRDGVSSASMVFDGTELRGSVVFADGSSVPISGARKGPSETATTQAATAPSTAATTTSTKQPTTQASTQMTSKPTTRGASFEPMFPLGAYGRDGIPKQNKYVWIRNATIWTSADAGVIKNGEIVINEGKIAYVGAAIPRTVPVDAIIIDASGRHVSPGVIDAHSHIATDGGVNEGGQAITCEVRIGDFIDATQINIYRQLAAGVTTSNILHGSANAIGGQNQVIKLRWGALPEQLKFEGAKPGVKFALGENPKQSNWGDRFNSRYPQTRMGVEQIMLDAFEAARDYQRRWVDWNAKHEGIPPRRDLELDALVEIITGKRMIHCHSYRQDEILALIRTAERIGFKIDVFQHILEGYKVAPEMQKHGAMASTFSDWWAYKFEVWDAIPYNGALMKQAGLIVSFNSDDAEMARRLNSEAAKAVKYGGVEPAEALKFVTLNAAKQMYIDDRVGSLEVGKDADLVIWSGSPLSPASRVEQTWIDGRKYFDRTEDLAARKEVEKMKATLVQKILSDGKPMAEPGEFPKKPSALLADHDEYCGHDHQD
jgi:N-acetylglucosamine-6-phosphate deacetylase